MKSFLVLTTCWTVFRDTQTIMQKHWQWAWVSEPSISRWIPRSLSQPHPCSELQASKCCTVRCCLKQQTEQQQLPTTSPSFPYLCRHLLGSAFSAAYHSGCCMGLFKEREPGLLQQPGSAGPLGMTTTTATPLMPKVPCDPSWLPLGFCERSGEQLVGFFFPVKNYRIGIMIHNSVKSFWI